VRFLQTLAIVEQGKAALAAAAPSGRRAGIPLAEALAAFEQGLRDALASMSAWRRPEVEGEWTACQEGLEGATRRAEALRLGEAPGGYEGLYGQLGDLMEPLDPFGDALERFQQLAR
jgi:hypothetical protein